MKNCIIFFIFIFFAFSVYGGNYLNEFFGFKVESSQYETVENETLFQKAFIYLPESFGGEKQVIKGLRISDEKNAILTPGIGEVAVNMTTTYGDINLLM